MSKKGLQYRIEILCFLSFMSEPSFDEYVVTI